MRLVIYMVSGFAFLFFIALMIIFCVIKKNKKKNGKDMDVKTRMMLIKKYQMQAEIISQNRESNRDKNDIEKCGIHPLLDNDGNDAS